jgi:hypothetical protein
MTAYQPRLLVARASAILLVVAILGSCAFPGVTPPYTAQVDDISPDLPGVEFRATRGAGGELEITNHTEQELVLLDEHAQPYIRLAPDGLYELRETTWVRTKDSPVHYCHDPRIVYDGPEPDSRKTQVVKRWTIAAQLGDQTITVTGRTIYQPHDGRLLQIVLPTLGVLLCCAAVFVALAVAWLASRAARSRKSPS